MIKLVECVPIFARTRMPVPVEIIDPLLALKIQKVRKMINAIIVSHHDSLLKEKCLSSLLLFISMGIGLLDLRPSSCLEKP